MQNVDWQWHMRNRCESINLSMLSPLVLWCGIDFFKVFVLYFSWICAPKSFLHLLDKVQSDAIHLINNPNLTKSLPSLFHHHLVADLSIFYHYFYCHCSLEIRNIIPDPVQCVSTTRSSTQSHPSKLCHLIHKL